MITTTLPGFTSRLTPLSALTPPKCLWRSLTTMMFSWLAIGPHPPFYQPYDDGQQHRHREVQHRQSRIRLAEPEGPPGVQPRNLGNVAHRQHRNQRRVLHHRDEVIAECGQHV